GIANAARSNDSAAVRAAVARGIPVDTKDASGRTALWWASWNGNYQLVNFLLSHGANPRISSKHLGSSLNAAAARGHIRVIQRLLKYGMNPEIKGVRGQPPIWDAINECHL